MKFVYHQLNYAIFRSRTLIGPMTVLKTENYTAVDLLHKTFTFVLILQPDEPYVSYIGSNGDYNPFVYQAGISSMDIRFMGGPESMQNLSMVFPTRFTSKKQKT